MRSANRLKERLAPEPSPDATGQGLYPLTAGRYARRRACPAQSPAEGLRKPEGDPGSGYGDAGCGARNEPGGGGSGQGMGGKIKVAIEPESMR